jgi:zinc protease
MKHMSIPRTLLALGVMGTAAACAPAAAPAPADSPAPARSQTPPAALAERPLQFPEFRETRLPNGLPMIIVEQRGQPVVNINLYVRSGSASDPAAHAGRAGMVGDLLTQGTQSRSAQQIAETIEGVGGRLTASAGGDWLSVGSTVLSEHLPLAFDLVSDVSLRPTFPEREFDTIRRRTLSALQAQMGQPGAIAQRRFLSEVYGEHPYGISPVPATVEGLDRQDLIAFHREHFTPGNALLVVSGDVRASEVEALAARHFGDWQGTGAATRAFPSIPARDQARIYLVHRPGSVQSNIWIGHVGITPDHQDYFPLQVLNKILGQGTDARLFQILREQKGWTYGAYSRFTRPQDVGYFAASAEVRTEVTDSAVAEMMHQLRRLRDEPVPAEEFNAAVSFLAGSFPLRIETPGQVASQVAQARLLGLPVEDVTAFRERILAVTPADVQRVAREHVRPEQAAIVVVGDATRVLAGLEPIAPIVLYDVEGARIERSALEVRGSTERFDATRLRPMSMTYQMLVQDNPMGTGTYRVARDGGDWVVTSLVDSPVMRQEGEVRFGATDFAPRSSSMEMQQGQTRMVVDLNVVDGRVTGQLQLPPQAGGERDVDVELVPGMLLPGMDQFVLAAADLTEGRTITLPMFDPASGAVSNVNFRVSGSESVTVPAGTFETLRLEASGPQPMTLYLRGDAPHILIRQDFAGAPISLVLQEFDES